MNSTTGRPRADVAVPPGPRVVPGNWFSIGMFSGPSPLELSPAPAANNPVLTYGDVTDIPAIFVADPFMVRHDDGLWYMFLEVLNEATYNAEISLAVSRNGLNWQYQGVVLTEPFALSYSYVFRWQGEYYMLPEMYGEDYLQLYRAETFPTGWRPVTTLLEGSPIADASIFHYRGHWYIFACPRPAHHDELRLYWAGHLDGPWHEHPMSPVITGDPRNARPGGRVIAWGEGLLRFAQDCYPRYGTGLRAFEITRLTPEEYAERPAGSPFQQPDPGAWNSLAMHHIDAHRLEDGSWLAVADGHNHPSYANAL